jgi:hypothetical protein
VRLEPAISAGMAGEGTNSTYCHPRRETVDALTAALGGPGEPVIHAFPSEAGCSRTHVAERDEVRRIRDQGDETLLKRQIRDEAIAKLAPGAAAAAPPPSAGKR